VFNVVQSGPCLRCIFNGSSNETCSTLGILNSASTIIGSFMVSETIKILLNKKYEKYLLTLDIWKNEINKVIIKKRKECQTCNAHYEYLNGKIKTNITSLCGNEVYQIKGKRLNLDELEKSLSKLGKVTKFNGVLHFNNITMFENGRIIFKTIDKKEAKDLYSKLIGN
jgi:hypothetical protein